MGATLKYVKEFDFGSTKTPVKGYCRGGPMKKADGGAVKTAVHKHEKAMHTGEPLTKLKNGGRVSKP